MSVVDHFLRAMASVVVTTIVLSILFSNYNFMFPICVLGFIMIIFLLCIDLSYRIIVKICGKYIFHDTVDGQDGNTRTNVISNVVNGTGNEQFIVQMPLATPTAPTEQIAIQPSAPMESNDINLDIDPPPKYDEPPKYEECIKQDEVKVSKN